MIYAFPHCSLLVTPHEIVSAFVDPEAPDDLARVRSTRDPFDDLHLAAALAAHLVSYAVRGTPSPGNYVDAGGVLAEHPLYRARVEGDYSRDAERRLAGHFVRMAYDQAFEMEALGPLVAKVEDMDAFVERFFWFLVAPNYCNYIKV